MRRCMNRKVFYSFRLLFYGEYTCANVFYACHLSHSVFHHYFIKHQALIRLSKSRHKVVCRVAQENGACANGVSILTGTTKSQFSRIRRTVIPHPNDTKFTVELASTQGRPDFKF